MLNHCSSTAIQCIIMPCVYKSSTIEHIAMYTNLFISVEHFSTPVLQ